MKSKIAIGFVALVVAGLIMNGIQALGIVDFGHHPDPAVTVCDGHLRDALGSAYGTVVVHPPIVERLAGGVVQVNGSWFSAYADRDLHYLCSVRDGRVETFTTS